MVVVVGLLAIFLIPRDALNTIHLQTAAAKVQNDLHYAKELAITTNTNCGVSFEANGSYTVYQQSLLTPAVNPLTQQPYVIDIGQLFKNIRIQNTVRIEFDPTGKPVLGGGLTVQVSSPQSALSLYVTPNTGLIQQL